jgi:hypothetical protein
MTFSPRWLFLLLLLCAVLYFPGLRGPFLLDDFPQLEGLINHADSGFSYLLQEYLISSSGPFGRPVAMFSFIMDATIWGKDPWFWKMTNVAIHLGCAIALFYLTLILLKNRLPTTSNQISVALFITSAWMLHPMHTSTVLYLVQRMTELSALFTILCLISYIKGRETCRIKKNGYKWLFVALGICLPLAIFSKENALLIPIYLLLIEWIHFSNSTLHQFWGKLNLHHKRLLFALMIFLLSISIWLVMEYVISNGYANRPFSLQERLLTEPRILVKYLAGILSPNWSNLGFYHDDIQTSTGLLTPISTLLSVMLLAGMVALGIVLRKHNPVASFGILLFFASHLLESSIFPLELMFEHRNYLGSFGIILAIAALIAPHIVSARIFAIASGIVLAVLSLLLLQFSYIWGDKERLDTQLYAAHPDSPSAIAIMADQYVNAWSPHLAWEILDRPERAGFKLHAMVIRCRVSHRLADSEFIELNKRIDSLIQSYELTGLIELANQGLDNQCNFSSKQFMEILDLAIINSTQGMARQKLLVYKAYFQKKSGELEDSFLTLEQAFGTAPLSPMPLFLAADWLIDAGDKARARQYYQRAIAASDPKRAITAEYISHFHTKFAPEQ